jgi:hypothetical protein
LKSEMIEIVHALIVSYLVATLGATGLAKLVNGRTAAVGMIREGALPSRMALPTILAAAVAEIALAVLLAIGFYPEIAAFGTSGLFVLFAGYRILVAAKVNAIVCSCAGTVRTDPASPPAVVGSVLACICLAGIACSVPFLGKPSGYPLNLIIIFSLALPVTGMIAGHRARKKNKHRPDNRFPVRHVALGTEKIL